MPPPPIPEALLEFLNDLKRIFKALRDARRRLLIMRQVHPAFILPHPIKEIEGGVEIDVSKMEDGTPYLFEFQGATLAAVRTGDGEVDIYELPYVGED